MNLKCKIYILVAFLLMDCILIGILLNNIRKPVGTINMEASVVEDTDHMLALTFDDGPHPEYTEELLDGLKERGVHVTFFLMGKSIEGNEELVKRMSDEGHLIGNHSFHHVKLTKETSVHVFDEIEKTNQIIYSITGQTPMYIRPPFGAWNDELEGEIEMTPVLWDIDPLDWKVQNKQKVVNHIMKHAEDNDIILLHDIFKTSVDAALEVIDKLSEKGYTFVTVDEIMVD